MSRSRDIFTTCFRRASQRCCARWRRKRSSAISPLLVLLSRGCFICWRKSVARSGSSRQDLLLDIRRSGGRWLRAKRDRKSTRLNSSHLVISYAVFCLKKKKNRKHQLSQARVGFQTGYTRDILTVRPIPDADH